MLTNWFLIKVLPDAPYVLSKRILDRAESLPDLVTILDIGGGSGSLWREVESLVGSRCKLEIVILDGVTVATGEDSPNWSRVKGDLPSALISFQDSSFHFVTAFEVIEHLPKHDGYSMLYEMERIALYGYGVSTPNKFLWQPPSPNNRLNSHISEWTWGDFRQFGMQSIFLHSPKKLGWILIFLTRKLRISKALAGLKIFTGLSAWRWTMRDRVAQPLIPSRQGDETS